MNLFSDAAVARSLFGPLDYGPIVGRRHRPDDFVDTERAVRVARLSMLLAKVYQVASCCSAKVLSLCLLHCPL